MNAVTARSVGEAMTRGLITVRTSALVYEAAQLMDAHRVHGLPVLDADGAIVGVVSQSDLLRAKLDGHLWKNHPPHNGRLQKSRKMHNGYICSQTATLTRPTAAPERARGEPEGIGRRRGYA